MIHVISNISGFSLFLFVFNSTISYLTLLPMWGEQVPRITVLDKVFFSCRNAVIHSENMKKQSCKLLGRKCFGVGTLIVFRDHFWPCSRDHM